MSEFVETTEPSAPADGPDVTSNAEQAAETSLGVLSCDPDPSATEESIARLHGALRLALRAADADVTCLVAGERITLWASRKRSSASTTEPSQVFAPDPLKTRKSKATSVLAKWMTRAKTVRLPVCKEHGIFLVASRRRSRGKFSRTDGMMLQDAARLVAAELDATYSRVANAALSAATENARLGVFITDLNGRVIFSNGAAKRFMTTGRGLRITDNRLTGRCSGEHTPLRDCLTDLTDIGALAIEADDGSVSPVVAKRLQIMGRKALAIYVDDPEYPSPPAEWLREVYRMTKREAEVSALLAGGLNVSEIAGQLGLSETTVKSYCKDVFAKLDVRRKPDLVRILAAGPLTLAAPLPPGIDSSRLGSLTEPMPAVS